MAIFDLDRRLDLWHGDLNATSVSIHYITYSIRRPIRYHLIRTVVSNSSCSATESTEDLIVPGSHGMKVRERQEQAVHHDLEVAHHVRTFDPHVVDPHRRRRQASTTGSRDHQRLASLERRQRHSKRELLKVRERQEMIRHDVETDVAGVRVRAREDRHVINGKHRHIVESEEFSIFNLHRERQDAKPVVTEPEHGVP